jgi:CRISPR/Cas system-associated endonuclease/helicase Cas3
VTAHPLQNTESAIKKKKKIKSKREKYKDDEMNKNINLTFKQLNSNFQKQQRNVPKYKELSSYTSIYRILLRRKKTNIIIK